MKNEDKRIGKNPAGYLVASIRADYQAPGDFPAAEPAAPPRPPRPPTAEAAADPRPRPEAARTTPRPPATRPARPSSAAAWEALPESERDEILAAVKAANPGISRWRKMLEPLCLTALEARLGGARQKSLFPDAGTERGASVAGGRLEGFPRL